MYSLDDHNAVSSWCCEDQASSGEDGGLWRRVVVSTFLHNAKIQFQNFRHHVTTMSAALKWIKIWWEVNTQQHRAIVFIETKTKYLPIDNTKEWAQHTRAKIRQLCVDQQHTAITLSLRQVVLLVNSQVLEETDWRTKHQDLHWKAKSSTVSNSLLFWFTRKKKLLTTSSAV